MYVLHTRTLVYMELVVSFVSGRRSKILFWYRCHTKDYEPKQKIVSGDTGTGVLSPSTIHLRFFTTK